MYIYHIYIYIYLLYYGFYYLIGVAEAPTFKQPSFRGEMLVKRAFSVWRFLQWSSFAFFEASLKVPPYINTLFLVCLCMMAATWTESPMISLHLYGQQQSHGGIRRIGNAWVIAYSASLYNSWNPKERRGWYTHIMSGWFLFSTIPIALDFR